MSGSKEINTIYTIGKKYIDAVNAYINNELDQNTLANIQDEFNELLNDLGHSEMTITLTKTSQHIKHELNRLQTLAEKIDDYHLNKAIISAEKVLEEIEEIGELNYVSKISK